MAGPIQAWRVLKDSEIEPAAVAGATVFDCVVPDYGAANQDSRRTGIRHVAVTFDPAGGYPYFTIPERDLEPLA
jgi:hypothetical protein